MFRKIFSFFFMVACCVIIDGCTRDTMGLKSIVIPDLLPFTMNTSPYWQVGYSADNLPALSQFQLCTYADTSDSIAIWHPGTGQLYPYTGQNRSNLSRLHSSGQWALRPHQIAMEGSNTGQLSMLRFIAPAAGNYSIKAIFEGVHFGLSSTDVHVLLNELSLFDDIIEGYGGDPAFHAVTGSHPSAVYENTIYLQKADIITFAVGYGANKTFYNDTTGLLISIERA